jgi:hypothetical protein
MKEEVLTDEELDRLLIEYMPKANILLEQLEEERDKNMTPHVFSKHYRKNMKKIIKEYSRSPIQKQFATLGKYAAGILILIILTNSALIVSVEAYRENFFETMTNAYKKFTSIIIEVEKPSDDNLSFIEPSYIPEGFELISDMQTDITMKIDYINNDSQIITFQQSIITNGERIIDTEDTSIAEITINNNTINYILNKDAYNAYWNDNKFIYSIIAEVSFEEFVKIIEGIIKK